MVKVVYFIQSHKNPEQILRLIGTIKQSSPNSLVLVSHDFQSSDLEYRPLQKRFGGIEVIPRQQSVRRGDASILQVYLEAVLWLRQHEPTFDWLVCLSGQDYPLQPASQIEAFLENTQYDGFIDYWDVLASESPAGRKNDYKRFFSQYISLPLWTRWWLRKLSRLERFAPLRTVWFFGLVGIKATTTPFSDRFRCYRGWYWFTLSKSCLDYLISYLDTHPQLLRYYRRTLAPEESLVQTVLVNSNRFNLHNGSLRYMEFPLELRGYARELTLADYPQLIKSNCHFGRKVDLNRDRALLDLLDSRIFASERSGNETSNTITRTDHEADLPAK